VSHSAAVDFSDAAVFLVFAAMLKLRLGVVSEWKMIEGICMRWQDNGGEKSRMEVEVD
jgi:hypothetical protein